MLSLSTELILTMMTYIRDEFPDAHIGMTKSIKDFPDALATLFIKTEGNLPIYVFFNGRYSKSQNEFVYLDFLVRVYEDNHGGLRDIYESISDRSRIYIPNAKASIKAEMKDSLTAMRKELS